MIEWRETADRYDLIGRGFAGTIELVRTCEERRFVKAEGGSLYLGRMKGEAHA